MTPTAIWHPRDFTKIQILDLYTTDERVLPVNQRQRVFPNGTLLIMAMQPGVDDGLYSCEVSPGQDMTAVSRSFRIIIRSPQKQHLGGKQFTDHDDIQHEVLLWMTHQPKEFYAPGIGV
ncbi:down syndrome cell adhesion molecule-like protein Dscam2 [Trichonephila inaurata madagascariensis]|uniref:Down syndrome cell adhesion molecule-like protein Dscam2 n=1 Tax=Trichonephila inaurata madagascariensis TaxID=2747483 RepID=A0A8X6MDC0_9ARAC|nr:down syndrome cell adhesion molecule-like protein Dscam2 [Trichonephila inaurata madagascariensis]